jgi:hypothetical protein
MGHVEPGSDPFPCSDGLSELLEVPMGRGAAIRLSRRIRDGMMPVVLINGLAPESSA